MNAIMTFALFFCWFVQYEASLIISCDDDLNLTTSGASMSCRKEWRLRVDSGLAMRVIGQRWEACGSRV